MVLSQKQKWIIGCGGGCLGFFLLIVLLFVGVFLWVRDTSGKATEHLFGKAPVGYSPLIGLEMDDPSLYQLSLLMSSQHKTFLLGWTLQQDTQTKMLLAPPKSEPNTIVKDTANLTIYDEAIDEFLEVNGATRNISTRKSKLEGIAKIASPSGKIYPVYRLKLAQAKTENYTPSLLVAIPQAESATQTTALPNVTLLVFVDTESNSSDAEADFSASYSYLTRETSTVLSNSKF